MVPSSRAFVIFCRTGSRFTLACHCILEQFRGCSYYAFLFACRQGTTALPAVRLLLQRDQPGAQAITFYAAAANAVDCYLPQNDPSTLGTPALPAFFELLPLQPFDISAACYRWPDVACRSAFCRFHAAVSVRVAWMLDFPRLARVSWTFLRCTLLRPRTHRLWLLRFVRWRVDYTCGSRCRVLLVGPLARYICAAGGTSLYSLQHGAGRTRPLSDLARKITFFRPVAGVPPCRACSRWLCSWRCPSVWLNRLFAISSCMPFMPSAAQNRSAAQACLWTFCSAGCRLYRTLPANWDTLRLMRRCHMLPWVPQFHFFRHGAYMRYCAVDGSRRCCCATLG